MLRILSLMLLLTVAALFGLECEQFGPQPDVLFCASLQTDPICFGGMDSLACGLYLQNGESWQLYPFWGQNFPMHGVAQLNATTMLGLFGMGSYSEGVYNFNLNTHNWSINYWFIQPKFITRDPLTGYFWVGERDGLFRSLNGTQWARMAALGSDFCTSFACHGTRAVANNGANVWYSENSGQNWTQSGMNLLKGFRFAADGTLYGIIAAESDSDGLWCSHDFGATWEPVFYSSNLSYVGPDFWGTVPVAWSQENEFGGYLALQDGQDALTPLAHASLNSGIHEMELFPLVNTPSFYVLNASGCYFLTGFVTSLPAEEVPAQPACWIRVAPQPATSEAVITLDGQASRGGYLGVFNLRGEKVRSLTLSGRAGESCIWDLTGDDGRRVATGIYLIVWTDSGGDTLARTRLAVRK